MLLAWLECLHTVVAEAAGLSSVGCCSFWAISAECCSCTVGVWKWDESLKCAMKCFWVGRRWKAAALSSAGNLPLAIPLPVPSAINICIISKGLIHLQYKMYFLYIEFSLCWGSLHLLLTSEWSCYLFCGVSAASYSLPKRVIADCKHLPIQCVTEAVDLYNFTFSVLLQWGSCWFLLWYLEGLKSIFLPFGHSYIICMVIPFNKWNRMSPKKSSVTVWAEFFGLQESGNEDFL